MIATKKDYDKLIKFIQLKDRMVAWAKKNPNELERKKELVRIFNGVEDHLNCKGEIINVDYEVPNGFRLSNPHWVTCDLKSFYLEFYLGHERCVAKAKHKKYLLSVTCPSVRGLPPIEAQNVVSDFFTHFLNGLDQTIAKISDNMDKLEIEEGKKEFGMFAKTEENYYKIKAVNNHKQILAVKPAEYAHEVRSSLSDLATKEDIKELKRQLLREDLKEFEQAAGVNPNHILSSDFKDDAFKSDDEIDAEEKKDDANKQ